MANEEFWVTYDTTHCDGGCGDATVWFGVKDDSFTSFEVCTVYRNQPVKPETLVQYLNFAVFDGEIDFSRTSTWFNVEE